MLNSAISQKAYPLQDEPVALCSILYVIIAGTSLSLYSTAVMSEATEQTFRPLDEATHRIFGQAMLELAGDYEREISRQIAVGPFPFADELTIGAIELRLAQLNSAVNVIFKNLLETKDGWQSSVLVDEASELNVVNMKALDVSSIGDTPHAGIFQISAATRESEGQPFSLITAAAIDRHRHVHGTELAFPAIDGRRVFVGAYITKLLHGAGRRTDLTKVIIGQIDNAPYATLTPLPDKLKPSAGNPLLAVVGKTGSIYGLGRNSGLRRHELVLANGLIRATDFEAQMNLMDLGTSVTEAEAEAINYTHEQAVAAFAQLQAASAYQKEIAAAADE